MAFTDKIIFNQKTGQLIQFIQTSKDTSGNLLEMNVSFTPQAFAPPMHYHPIQTEIFRVISGQLTIRLQDKILILQQGHTLKIPPNVKHTMWNASDHKTIVNWQIQPALQTEYLLETLTGLANDNLTNSRGVPGLLQKVVTASKFRDCLRLTNPPYLIQKILFAIISPFAILCGYQAADKKYVN